LNYWKNFFLAAGAGHMKENNYAGKDKEIEKSSIVCRGENGPHMVDDWEKGEVYREELYPAPKVYSFSFPPFRRTRPLNKS
jgi:hypothetical protein